MTSAAPRQLEILMVDDNPGDVRLTREVLRDSAIQPHLNAVVDGAQALEYLRQHGPYSDAVRPDVILLDLNLPKKDGRQVLAEIKDDPELRRIPVVVLTTSSADDDVNEIYDLHANCYVTKPMALDQFTRVIQLIETFWLATAQLPTD